MYFRIEILNKCQIYNLLMNFLISKKKKVRIKIKNRYKNIRGKFY